METDEFYNGTFQRKIQIYSSGSISKSKFECQQNNKNDGLEFVHDVWTIYEAITEVKIQDVINNV